MTYPSGGGGVRVRRGYADVSIGQMHYREAGERTDASPILLFHRTPTSSVMWKRLLPALGASHWVLAPDTAGFGMSDPLPERPGPTMKPYVDLAIEFMDALEIERATLVGHSTGSAIAIHLAADHPERAEKVIVTGFTGVTTQAEVDELFKTLQSDMSPSWGQPIELDGQGAFLEQYPLDPLRSVIAEFDDPEHFVGELIAHLQGLPDYEWPFEAVLAFPGQQARFAEIRCPVLFVSARSSMGHPFDRKAHERFAGSHWVELDGTSEYPMQKSQELAAAINAFVTGDPAPPRASEVAR